jgi:hypothetical protein
VPSPIDVPSQASTDSPSEDQLSPIEEASEPSSHGRPDLTSSSEDMPLRKVCSRPRSPKGMDSSQKRSAYVITPLRSRGPKPVPPIPTTPPSSPLPLKYRLRKQVPPSPTTPSHLLSPLVRPIATELLGPATWQCFFSSLTSLIYYVDTKTKAVDLFKFGSRCKQFAFYGIYPNLEVLLVLIASKSREDIKVSLP